MRSTIANPKPLPPEDDSSYFGWILIAGVVFLVLLVKGVMWLVEGSGKARKVVRELTEDEKRQVKKGPVPSAPAPAGPVTPPGRPPPSSPVRRQAALRSSGGVLASRNVSRQTLADRGSGG